MEEHLKKSLEDFREIRTPAITPANIGLFNTDKKYPKAEEYNRKKFHIIVMFLACTALRGIKDIQMHVA